MIFLKVEWAILLSAMFSHPTFSGIPESKMSHPTFSGILESRMSHPTVIDVDSLELVFLVCTAFLAEGMQLVDEIHRNPAK